MPGQGAVEIGFVAKAALQGDGGGTWTFDSHSSLRLDLYNLLGLIDPKLNRRLYRGDADYRSEAVTAALTYEYKF